MYVTGTEVENCQILCKNVGALILYHTIPWKNLKLEQLVFVFPHFPEIIRKHMLHFIINLQGIFEVSGDGVQAPIHEYWSCN